MSKAQFINLSELRVEVNISVQREPFVSDTAILLAIQGALTKAFESIRNDVYITVDSTRLVGPRK